MTPRSLIWAMIDSGAINKKRTEKEKWVWGIGREKIMSSVFNVSSLRS